MLNANWLQTAPDNVAEIWGEAEDIILQDTARMISEYDYFTPSAQHHVQLLRATGASRQSITKELGKLTGKTQKEVADLLTQAGNEVVKVDSKKYKLANIYKATDVNTKALNNVLNKGTQSTLAELRGIIKSTAINGSNQVYNAIDRAQMLVSTGAFSQEQAIEQAIKTLSDHGLDSIVYASGHKDSLETAVRRAVQTGVNQTSLQIRMQLANDVGCDLVEVTAHAGARPSHAVWQGKVFSISGKTKGYKKLATATGYGSLLGLGGVNCRHQFFPYIEGTASTWSKQELRDLKKKSITYNGKKMTKYDASQIQRGIERNMRRLKREKIMREAAGLDTDHVDKRLAWWENKQKDFINQTGLRRQYGREQVYMSDLVAGQANIQSQYDAIIQQMQSIDKTFSGLWKDDVTLADYSTKKGGIQSKKSYYNNKISEYEHKLDILDPDDPDDVGAIKWAENQKAKMEQMLADLEEYEKLGAQYEQMKAEADALSGQIVIKKSVPGSVADKFDDSLYTKESKAAAKAFRDRETADKYHRPYLDSIWDDLTDEEKYGIWKYTENSNPMNKPLSGYHQSWDRVSFKGLDKTDWGNEDGWRNNPASFRKFGHANGNVDHRRAIGATTRAIDKSEFQDGVWLVRGSTSEGLAGLFEGDIFSYNDALFLINECSEADCKKAFVNQTFTNHAFTSTGIATNAGFGGNVKYRIYAPKGTHGIYAEPQSYWGDTLPNKSKLYKPGDSYRSVGGEAEIIIQRGTQYRVTDIKVTPNAYDPTRPPDIEIEMEIVGQPDYFKTGFEDTYNGGQTIHKT